MIETFQQSIDKALAPVPNKGQVVSWSIHWVPVQEEEHRADILALLQKNPPAKKDNQLHIGVAGFFNFEIAAITRPDYLLLLDNNKNQKDFWLHVVELLKTCDSAEEFRQKFSASMVGEELPINSATPDLVRSVYSLKVSDNGVAPLRGAFGEAIKKYMSNASWLKDEASYQNLHQMACDEKIAAAIVDLEHDQARCETLGAAIKGLGLHSQTCYWSNIGSYMHPFDNCDNHVSSNDDVFATNTGGLTYPGTRFYSTRSSLEIDSEPVSTWMGEATKNTPNFERFLNNISLIGNDKGTIHMLTDTKDTIPLIISEGPLRRPHTARLSAERRQTAAAGIKSPSPGVN